MTTMGIHDTDQTSHEDYAEPDVIDAEPMEHQSEADDIADYTWQELAEKLSRIPKADAMKMRLILGITVLSKGRPGWTIDWDAVAALSGHQAGSLTSYQKKLADEGWAVREAGVSAEGRPVFIHKTTKTVRG
jgi:hypothetical protein